MSWQKVDAVKHGKPAWRLPLCSAAVAFGFLVGMLSSAHSDCLSPSAVSGTTATTVYRCQEQQRKADPLIASPSRTTVVERGSADTPWFDQKPAEKADPSEVPASQPTQLKQEAAAFPTQVEQEAEAKPAPTNPKAKVKKSERKLPAKTKPARKKLVKMKPAKMKSAKALKAKAKPTETPSSGNAAPKNPDDNVVVWTRKDMPLGNRIGSWLGL